MKHFVVGVLTVCASTSLAGADAADDNYVKHDLKRVADSIKTTPPAAGVDKATLTGPGWCPPLKEKPYTGGFDGHLESYYNAPDTKLYELIGAASKLCHNDPKQPVIQKAATEMLQLYMNRTGLSQADAVEAFRLWKDEPAAEAHQKKLCQALALDAEVHGPERAFMLAKRELFNCGGGESISQTGSAPMNQLIPWLDSAAKEPDELVRLAYVFKESEAYAKAYDDYKAKNVPFYAVGQIDYKLFQPKAALALLDSAPYKGNPFAAVVVKEAIGSTRLNVAALEAEVKKLTAKDADWKAILIDAPQKGAADWTAAAAKYKAELQRSAEFEAQAYGPSKKAFAGCQDPLKKDLAAILKPLKHDNPQQLIEEMNAHPVAGMLFRRFEACVGGAGDPSASAEMGRNVKGLRVVRGPRAAAIYAAIDAIGKVRADRAKFPVEENDLKVLLTTDTLHELAYKLRSESKNPSAGVGEYGVYNEQGVIKTVTKSKEGLKVVFAKDKQERYVEGDCVTTNRIVTWDISDGRPIYYRKCKGSVKKVDVSPYPILVPPHLTEGVAAGRMINFGVSNSADKRISMPFEVYGDKKGKKLVAWYTIPL